METDYAFQIAVLKDAIIELCNMALDTDKSGEDLDMDLVKLRDELKSKLPG